MKKDALQAYEECADAICRDLGRNIIRIQNGDHLEEDTDSDLSQSDDDELSRNWEASLKGYFG